MFRSIKIYFFPFYFNQKIHGSSQEYINILIVKTQKKKNIYIYIYIYINIKNYKKNIYKKKKHKKYK